MGKKVKGKGSEISAVLTGVICAIAICLAGLGGLTQMVLLEKIWEKGSQTVILILLLVSSMIGCLLTSRTTDKNQITAIMGTVCGLALIMLISGFAIDGAFKSVVLNLGSVMIGGGISCVLCLKKPKKNRFRKRRYR